MDQRVTILVGNGFNYFVNQYIVNETPEILVNKLEQYKKALALEGKDINIQLQNLQIDLTKYCNLLDFLKLEDYPESGETLLSKLNIFFKSLDSGKSEISQNIMKDISELVSEQINAIFDETTYTEDQDHFKYVNATVKTLMKVDNQYFSSRFEKIISKFSTAPYDVYTTNYDYIVNSVFSELDNHNTISNFKHRSVYNLHGHYNRAKEHGDIICCAPELKQQEMKLEYLESYVKTVDNSSIFILFGIGLTSDPHLLRELNRKKNCTFIIIDSIKEDYYKNHSPKSADVSGENGVNHNRFDFLNNNAVYYIDTVSHQTTENYLIHQINTPKKLITALNKVAEAINKR